MRPIPPQQMTEIVKDLHEIATEFRETKKRKSSNDIAVRVLSGVIVILMCFVAVQIVQMQKLPDVIKLANENDKRLDQTDIKFERVVTTMEVIARAMEREDGRQNP